MFNGQGKLLGYRTYKDKNGADKYVYSVLVGEIDTTTGLYKKSDYIQIIQSEQTLKTLKAQDVGFTATLNTFNGVTKPSYSNIHALEVVK